MVSIHLFIGFVEKQRFLISKEDQKITDALKAQAAIEFVTELNKEIECDSHA